MTADGDLIGRRYRIGRFDRAVGSLRRAPGTDTRLNRPVLIWMSETSGADEDALLEVARTVGQSASSTFLRILDVAYEDEGVAVILESAGGSLAEAGGLVPIEVRSAARLLDAVDRAVEDDGLTPARAARTDIFAADGDVIADPIALFLPAMPGEREIPTAVLHERLAALLIEHAEDGTALAQALSEDTASEMRSTARARGALVGAGAGGPYIDDDPTVVFTAPPPPVATIPTPRATSMPVAPPPVEERLGAFEPTPEPASTAEEAAPKPRRGAMPWRVFVPLYTGLALVVFGALFFALRSPDGTPTATPTTAAGQQSGPPAIAPAAGHVTVGLAATEDSGVRVTVDGVVQFDGTLAAGQKQAYDGKQRIDVWTDKGKTLNIAINGKNVGPYSPAIGHADWNRIDFSFWPGWTP